MSEVEPRQPASMAEEGEPELPVNEGSEEVQKSGTCAFHSSYLQNHAVFPVDSKIQAGKSFLLNHLRPAVSGRPRTRWQHTLPIFQGFRRQCPDDYIYADGDVNAPFRGQQFPEDTTHAGSRPRLCYSDFCKSVARRRPKDTKLLSTTQTLRLPEARGVEKGCQTEREVMDGLSLSAIEDRTSKTPLPLSQAGPSRLSLREREKEKEKQLPESQEKSQTGKQKKPHPVLKGLPKPKARPCLPKATNTEKVDMTLLLPEDKPNSRCFWCRRLSAYRQEHQQYAPDPPPMRFGFDELVQLKFPDPKVKMGNMTFVSARGPLPKGGASSSLMKRSASETVCRPDWQPAAEKAHVGVQQVYTVCQGWSVVVTGRVEVGGGCGDDEGCLRSREDGSSTTARQEQSDCRLSRQSDITKKQKRLERMINPLSEKLEVMCGMNDLGMNKKDFEAHIDSVVQQKHTLHGMHTYLQRQVLEELLHFAQVSRLARPSIR
uniref:Uncharacterized protein n=1 Tax=Chromera velia CCMP2878 TaxID=1169474 RepID=A0A0G4FNC9_9ALVE|eukprot:Cvel_17940.t1-p1 / transcript=Cvel_17940.t1 / gene=Cvel_17940 / organism=Chromera_velia_CCMP2878 / gene_product=hypothetical protein / transcript_product=hypothetical protein / location=Cvel_scaffold1458:24528-28671(+) / protein_length=487 / sequence_SO=supercontig / SO=protein_coding / is_pseudo=false